MSLTRILKAWKSDITAFVTDGLGLNLSLAQETLLRAIYALPLTPEQFELYKHCTGRERTPVAPFPEVTCVAGARSGKDSRIATPVALYEAFFGDHGKHLACGERAIIPLVATDARNTRVAFNYLKDYLTSSEVLSTMVQDVLASEIILKNKTSILCFPCTSRALRGWSIPAAILDELGFYLLEGSADTDEEIQASVRRGMVGFPLTRLVKISTPYMRSGVLYNDFKAGWGVDNPDLLVWKASSLLMNPTLEKRLEQEKRTDPSRYDREYGAEFSEDIAVFLPSGWVDDAIVAGRYELPYNPAYHYRAACDPSGGGADAFTFTIVHDENEGASRRVVQDVLKGWERVGTSAPDLIGVVKEIASRLRSYGLDQLVGDRYGGQWVRQAFRDQGISYIEAELDKSAAYLEVEPLFAQGRLELLDHERMAREWKILERRPRQGGRVVVDHPPRRHDDYANVLALAAASESLAPGAPVADGFCKPLHVAPSNLRPMVGEPIIVAQTFGAFPCTLIGQLSSGYIRVYAVLVAAGGLRHHYDSTVLPWLSQRCGWVLGGYSGRVIGRFDPAGETGAYGMDLEANPARLVESLLPGWWSAGPKEWEAKKGLLSAALTRHAELGQPALQINPEVVPLIEALGGKWYYNDTHEAPKRDHAPWASIGEAFCLFLSAVGSGPPHSSESLRVDMGFNVFDYYRGGRS